MSIKALQEKQNRYLSYLAQDPNNRQLSLDIEMLNAQILYHQEKLDEAILLLESLLNLNASNAEIAGLLGLIHFDNHNKIKAERFSKQALAMNPLNFEGLLVQTLLKGLRNEATIEEIQAMLSSNPNEGRLWFVLGTTHMREMDFLAAANAFNETNRIWPNFYDSWICLGWCYLIQDQIKKAEEVYQHAVELDNESADGWAGLALIHALNNQPEQAHHNLQTAEAIDTDCFLASMTRVILSNHISPDEAAKQFLKSFQHVTLQPEAYQ